MKKKTRLKVCTPEGKIIIAETETLDGIVKIRVPYLQVVEKDNPEFAKDGEIFFSVSQKKYQEAKKTLTKYLEDLFLKELDDVKIVHPGNGNRRNAGRAKSKPVSGSAEKAGRENGNPVHNRGGRGKSSSSDRGGTSEDIMASGGDQEDGGEGESRD